MGFGGGKRSGNSTFGILSLGLAASLNFFFGDDSLYALEIVGQSPKAVFSGGAEVYEVE